jgi:hypothetical protein
MQRRPADDPLCLWRGVDDAVTRATGRTPDARASGGLPVQYTPPPAPPVTNRPARVLESA